MQPFYFFRIWSTQLLANRDGLIKRERRDLRGFCLSPIKTMGFEAHSTLSVHKKKRELKLWNVPQSSQLQCPCRPRQSCYVMENPAESNVTWHTHTHTCKYTSGHKAELVKLFLADYQALNLCGSLMLKANPWAWPEPCLQEVLEDTSALSRHRFTAGAYAPQKGIVWRSVKTGWKPAVSKDMPEQQL